ncbi:hypothetical protein QCA50_010488 [Cerrena zonata]|uniref:Uncharacterized protein n=1 Tax=Cerrena zonata TaxID=2478898 RepID=A0AAW0G8G8_9APHY
MEVIMTEPGLKISCFQASQLKLPARLRQPQVYFYGSLSTSSSLAKESPSSPSLNASQILRQSYSTRSVKQPIPVSATVQIPTGTTHPSLLLATPSYKALEASTSVISLTSSVSASGKIQSSHASGLPVSNTRLEKLRTAASTSLDLSTLREAYFDTLLSDYYSSLPTSLSSFPTLSSHASMTVSLLEFPSSPPDSFWGSIDDVHSMISQLEEIANDLKVLDRPITTTSTLPPTRDKSSSTLEALSLSSWSTSASDDWLSSLNGSYPHSLAYLREDRSILEIEALLCNAQAGEWRTEVYITPTSTEPTIPLIVVTLPSANSLDEPKPVSEQDDIPNRTPKYVAPSLSPSKLKQPVSPPLDISDNHLTPIARPEPRPRKSRPRPLSEHTSPIQPARWVCDIVSLPLQLYPWGRRERLGSMRKKVGRKSKSHIWPANSADKTVVKSFFEDDGGVEVKRGLLWFGFKRLFCRSKFRT